VPLSVTQREDDRLFSKQTGMNNAEYLYHMLCLSSAIFLFSGTKPADIELKPAGQSDMTSQSPFLTIPEAGSMSFPTNDEVPDGQNRMPAQHLRSGKSHHLSDLLLHLRLVTVDSAHAARRLVFSERTFQNPVFRVRI
jgi:hypothetical protein